MAPTRLPLCPPRPPLPRPALPRHSRPGLRDGRQVPARLADHDVKHLVDYLLFRRNLVFGFRLTIQNTANRQVRNLFLEVSWLYLSRFPGARRA